MPFPLKVGFAGTPEFANVALRRLLDEAAKVQVLIALTQPDRPSGRGMKLTPSPVKTTALNAGISVLQTPSLKLDGRYPKEAEAAQQVLAGLELDVLVVAAYGLMLPRWTLELPRFGCLNIHGSLLPRWRGAAPVQRAIEAGDALTGVCIMQMDEGLDTGDVLLEKTVPIAAQTTTQALTLTLATEGANALIEALDQLAQGQVRRTPQSAVGVSYAKKIDKTEARIDWNCDAALIERRIRAFDPAPGAHFEFQGQAVKVWRASVIERQAGAAPGTVCAADARGLVIACKQGQVALEVLQRAGGRRMPVAEFLNAQTIPSGATLT